MFDLRPVTVAEIAPLVAAYHGYGSCGNTATYAFAVFEEDRIVAGYLWQPPPPGASKSVCPEQPAAVLALSRMVAVDKTERRLKHVSKPLIKQMKALIDRSRWPVLVTYSDEGQGHTGYVYRCSGWTATTKNVVPFFVNDAGARVSNYSNGKSGGRDLTRGGDTTIQRWEHWACARGKVVEHMNAGGWARVPIPGRVWRSGNQAHTFVRV